LNAAIFIGALLVVIMVHEAGHFFTAKAFDFKATKFFLGFGPTLWSIRRGETEYGIKAIPAGGFVKIIGMNPYEEVPAEDVPRSYPSKPRWQRALVLMAGPATHWPVAFLILLVVGMTIGAPTGRPTTEVGDVTVQIAGVDTPASQLGLQPDDRIVAIDGTKAESWDFVSDYIRSHAGQEVTFEIQRNGETRETSARLGTVIFAESGEPVEYALPGEAIRSLRPGEEKGGFVGIAPKEEFRALGLLDAAKESADTTWFFTTQSVKGVGSIFTQVIDGSLWRALSAEGPRGIDEGPTGIVGITQLAGSAEYFELWSLIAGLTIFVGLMNLLPLPPLDGGHLLVVAYESITRRAVDMRKLIPVAAAVLSFFIVLSLMVLYLDLARPIKLPG
jgi:membrane-associated protease RseP (regulator of RpoE activity)